VIFEVRDWEGHALADTALPAWLGRNDLPTDHAFWVLYRDTCPVCADCLARWATEEMGERDVVLVRAPPGPSDADEEIQVHRKPQGPWVHAATLPAGPDWVFTAPVTLEVEDGRVVKATEGEICTP
jgi:hypothetical protein